MWLYLCFIFSAESFTDIIIFYLLVCLSVRLLFSLSCAGSFCLFTFIFPFYWFLFSGVLVFPPGYVDVDSQICLSIYFSLCVLVSSCMFCPVFVIGCVVFCFLTIYMPKLSILIDNCLASQGWWDSLLREGGEALSQQGRVLAFKGWQQSTNPPLT